MTTFQTNELYVSQIPAMLSLMQFGYTCLSQKEAESMRGNLREVLLESVLADQILKLNTFTYRGALHQFDHSDAMEAIRKLKPSPIEQRRLERANQDIYDQLLLGTTIEKTIDDDRKSYSVKYIDWDTPSNNTYHVTAEFSVERSNNTSTRRCDIIIFVNGIPFVVIENKAPTISAKQGKSQNIRNQKDEQIPYLFYYAQLLIATNKNEAFYGAVSANKNYWLTWKDEEDKDPDIYEKINTPIDVSGKDTLFTGDFLEARHFFEAQADAGHRAVTEQDRILYALCRPERLLEMVRGFTVFDGGKRKSARYQQFFGVRETMRRVRQRDHNGKRSGGVIWHTQGSGKSLTMVMLGRALALAKDIPNARIIIATDRDDLDRQIRDTFKSCEMDPVRSASGANLIELLEQKKSLITTIINKFNTATRTREFIDDDANIFVLVDESHRTQCGSFAAQMRRILPKACYIGFTGTPLLKGEKNTFNTFGGIIHSYTIDDAVRDGAIVPLLYEGRYVEQNLSGTVIDSWFDRVAKGLTDEQKADLKTKFSRMTRLSRTEQAIYAKAIDISEHFRQSWQGTGRKGQIVAPSKAAAIQFKDTLDEIGHVTSEVIISPPDDRESNDDVDLTSKNRIQIFWNDMMKKYGSEEEYNRQIIENFKSSNDPEILIVVSKLLTGFDAPRNTILYICKPLREHNLLQAIARVNRLFHENDTEKQFGYIIDYEGLLGDLDEALTSYGSLEGYDPNDIKGVVVDIREELQKLPKLHQNLWDIFKEVPNKLDHEQFEQHLADDSIRDEFYIKLREFNRCLHTALSSEKAYDVYSKEQLEKYKADWKRFSNLKRSIQIRYQEIVDIKEFELKIQKLLDDHIIANPAQIIVKELNIHNPDDIANVLGEQKITDASKADRIASATKKTITEKMDIDPSFYKVFSEMLEETIRAYKEKRILETEYLLKVKEIANDVAKGKRDNVPESIIENQSAQAFYGIISPIIAEKIKQGENSKDFAAQTALDINQIINNHQIVNLWQNIDQQNNIKNFLEEYLFENVNPNLDQKLDENELNMIETQIMDIARARSLS